MNSHVGPLQRLKVIIVTSLQHKQNMAIGMEL